MPHCFLLSIPTEYKERWIDLALVSLTLLRLSSINGTGENDRGDVELIHAGLWTST